MSTCSRSLSSNMSKSSCPQCAPGEINVFEAKRYFSGSLGVEQGTNPGQLLERCMKEEKLSGGEEDISLNVNDMLENKHKLEKKGSDKQSKSSAAKLANFLSSLFKQTIYKKKSKLGIEPPEKCTEGRRRRSSSSSSFPQGSNNIICHSNNKFGGILFSSQRDDEECCDKWAKDEANWLSQRAKSIDKEAIWSEELMKKEEYSWCWMKEEEEEELERDGSESSSDLFELKNFDLGNDVTAYGSTNLDVVKTKASSFPSVAF